MGHQSYAIPYDTDEQLQAILDVIKLHNSHPSGYTDEYVRYRADQEYKLLEVGEELTGACTAALKAGKAYKCPRKGPALSRVVLVSHGGGRSSTFDFFLWHLRRALPDVYVDGYHAVDAYGYDHSLGNRLVKKSYERIDDARIGVVPSAQYTDAMREANLLAAYAPRPAKYSTCLPGDTPAAWTALMEGVTDTAERKKRARENPRVSPYARTYETTTNGWLVEGKHFAIIDEAKAYADTIRPGHVMPGCIAAMRAVTPSPSLATLALALGCATETYMVICVHDELRFGIVSKPRLKFLHGAFCAPDWDDDGYPRQPHWFNTRDVFCDAQHCGRAGGVLAEGAHAALVEWIHEHGSKEIKELVALGFDNVGCDYEPLPSAWAWLERLEENGVRVFGEIATLAARLA